MAIARTSNFDQWNRIINIEFLNKDGTVKYKITTPPHGRKPDIETNYEQVSTTSVHAMHLTIRNFYLYNIPDYGKITRINVEWGYEGRSNKFGASVQEMYQTEPGPDSSTVIIFFPGNVLNWIDKTVSGVVDKNSSFENAVNFVTNTLGIDAPIIQNDLKSVALVNKIEFNCTGREALQKLQTFFPDYIFLIDGDCIKVFSEKGEYEGAKIHTINYMSAPVQLTGGSGVAVTCTTLFNPAIKCGDIVEIPSQMYESTTIVRSTYKYIRFKPYRISVHFSTVKNVNKMVLEGTSIGGRDQ